MTGVSRNNTFSALLVKYMGCFKTSSCHYRPECTIIQKLKTAASSGPGVSLQHGSEGANVLQNLNLCGEGNASDLSTCTFQTV